MSDEDLCRICRGHQLPLYRPCRCSGSIASVHQHCLDFWLSRKQTSTCELCNTEIKHKSIYLDHAPRFVPLTKFFRAWYQRIRGGRSAWFRITFVFGVWAVCLPLLSLWATRFLFYGLYPPRSLIDSWSSVPLLCAAGGFLAIGGTAVFALESTLNGIVGECARFYGWWLEQSSLTSAALLAETLSLEGQVVRLYPVSQPEGSSAVESSGSSQQIEEQQVEETPPDVTTSSADPVGDQSDSLSEADLDELPAEVAPEESSLEEEVPQPPRTESPPVNVESSQEDGSEFMELIGLRGSFFRSFFCVALIWIASVVFAFISILVPYGQGRAWLHASLTALLTSEMTTGALMPEILPMAVGHMAELLPNLSPADDVGACVWSNYTDAIPFDEEADRLTEMLVSKMSGGEYREGFYCELRLAVEEIRRPRFHLHSGRSFSAWTDCLTQLFPDLIGFAADPFLPEEPLTEYTLARLDLSTLSRLADGFDPERALSPHDTYRALGMEDNELSLTIEASQVDFDVSHLFREFSFYRPLAKRILQRQPDSQSFELSPDSLYTLIHLYYEGRAKPSLQLRDGQQLLSQGKETPLRSKRPTPSHFTRRSHADWLRRLTARPATLQPKNATVAVFGQGAVSLQLLSSDLGVSLPYSLVGHLDIVEKQQRNWLQYRVEPILHPFPLPFSQMVWFATLWALGQRRMLSCLWLLSKAALSGVIAIASIALVLDWIDRCSGTKELTAAEEEARQRELKLKEKDCPKRVSYSKRLALLCFQWTRPITRLSPFAALLSLLCRTFFRIVKTMKSLVFFVLSFEELLAASSLTLLLDTVLPILLGRIAISLVCVSPWLQLPAEWSAWQLNENFVLVCILAHCIGSSYLNLISAVVFNAFGVIQKGLAESLILDHYTLLGFFTCTFAIMGRHMSSERSQSQDTYPVVESHQLPRTLLGPSRDSELRLPELTETDHVNNGDRFESSSFESSSQNLCKAFFATASIGDLTQALLAFLTTHLLLLSVIIFSSGWIIRLVCPSFLPLRVLPRASTALELHKPWVRQAFLTITSLARLIIGSPLETVRESIPLPNLVTQASLILAFSIFWIRRAIVAKQPMRMNRLSFLSAYMIDTCGFGHHLKPQWRRWLHTLGEDRAVEEESVNETPVGRDDTSAGGVGEVQDEKESAEVENVELTGVQGEGEGDARADGRREQVLMSIFSDMLWDFVRQARHYIAHSQDSSSAGEAHGTCLWVRRTFRQMDLPDGWVVRELASQVTIDLEKIYIAQDRVVAVECRRNSQERHVTFEAAPIEKKDFIMAGVFVARVWTHNETDGAAAKEEVQFQVWMPKTEIPNTDFGHVRFAASKIFLLFEPNVDKNGRPFDFPWKARGFYMTTDQRDAGDSQMRYTFRYVVAEGPKQYLPPPAISMRRQLSLMVRAGKPALLLLLAAVLATACSVSLSVFVGRFIMGSLVGASPGGYLMQSFRDFAQRQSTINTDLRGIPYHLMDEKIPTAEVTDIISGAVGVLFAYLVIRLILVVRRIGEICSSLKREKIQICWRLAYGFGLAIFYVGMPICEGAFFDLFFLRPVASGRTISKRWLQWFFLGLPAFSLWWGCLNFTDFGVWLSPLIFVGSLEVVDRETLREVGVLSLSFRSNCHGITRGHVKRLYTKFLARLAMDWLEWLILPLLYVVFGTTIAHCQHFLMQSLLNPIGLKIPSAQSFPFNVHQNFLQLVVLIRLLRWLEIRVAEDIRTVHAQVFEKYYLLRKELVDFERPA